MGFNVPVEGPHRWLIVPYQPVRSEVRGMVKMLAGIAFISFSGFLKTREIFTGEREVLLTPRAMAEWGVELISLGIEESSPGIAVVANAASAAAVYVSVKTLMTPEITSEEPMEIRFFRQLYS